MELTLTGETPAFLSTLPSGLLDRRFVLDVVLIAGLGFLVVALFAQVPALNLLLSRFRILSPVAFCISVYALLGGWARGNLPSHSRRPAAALSVSGAIR